MLKKFASIVILFAFAWLQTYQVCDASEDTLEAAESLHAILAGPRLVLQAPAAPEDDELDAGIPSVFDGTLQPNGLVPLTPVMHSHILAMDLPINEARHMDVSELHGPSPPTPIFLLSSSLHVLAPPAA